MGSDAWQWQTACIFSGALSLNLPNCSARCLNVYRTALRDLEKLVVLGAVLQEGTSQGLHCATSVLRSLPGSGNRYGYSTNI